MFPPNTPNLNTTSPNNNESKLPKTTLDVTPLRSAFITPGRQDNQPTRRPDTLDQVPTSIDNSIPVYRPSSSSSQFTSPLNKLDSDQEDDTNIDLTSASVPTYGFQNNLRQNNNPTRPRASTDARYYNDGRGRPNVDRERFILKPTATTFLPRSSFGPVPNPSQDPNINQVPYPNQPQFPNLNLVPQLNQNFNSNPRPTQPTPFIQQQSQQPNLNSRHGTTGQDWNIITQQLDQLGIALPNTGRNGASQADLVGIIRELTAIATPMIDNNKRLVEENVLQAAKVQTLSRLEAESRMAAQSRILSRPFTGQEIVSALDVDPSCLTMMGPDPIRTMSKLQEIYSAITPNQYFRIPYPHSYAGNLPTDRQGYPLGPALIDSLLWEDFWKQFPKNATSISPLRALEDHLRSYPKPLTLTQSSASLAEWKRDIERTLTSANLHCLTTMDIRIVPTTPREWELLDNHPICQEFKREFLYHIGCHTPRLPRVTKEDSLMKINGAFLAVTVSWPLVVSRCWTRIHDSLDQTYDSLKDGNPPPSETYMRTLYFESQRKFLIGSVETQQVLLTNFNNNVNLTYDVREQPSFYWSRLESAAKKVNLSANMEIINKAQLRIKYAANIKQATDKYHVEFTMHSNDPNSTIENLVKTLDVGYKSSQTQAALAGTVGSGYLNFSSDQPQFAQDLDDPSPDVDLESTNFAQNPTTRRQEPYRPQARQQGRGGGNQPYHESKANDRARLGTSPNKKDFPCFAFQKTGSCPYGAQCKYSHDKKTFNRDTPKAFATEQTDDLILALGRAVQSGQAAKTALNKWKKKYKGATKDTQKPKGQPQVKNSEQTFEQAIMETADNVAEVPSTTWPLNFDDDDIDDLYDGYGTDQ